MAKSTDTWCWMCGDPANCGVDENKHNCPYGPGKAAGLRIQAQQKAQEERFRAIVREEIAATPRPPQ